MVQHGTMLNKERIISCLNYLKLNMLKRGIEPLIKSAKIEKVTFAKNVINGKNNHRETIIKGMELDTFKNLLKVML